MPIFNVNHVFVQSNSNTYKADLHQSLMIDVPSKIWRPKPENRYVPLDYGDNIDDDLLVFTQYGKSVRRTPAVFESTRTDVRTFGTRTVILQNFGNTCASERALI
jgi:hypothetical protein